MTEVDAEEITSTFTQLGARHWEGTHVYGTTVVVRTFRNTEPGVLSGDTRYYSNGKAVSRMDESWRVLDHDTEHPHSYSGKPVDRFARDLHYANPVLDIETALDLI